MTEGGRPYVENGMIGQQNCTGTGDHVLSVLKLKKSWKMCQKTSYEVKYKSRKISKNIQRLPMTFKDLQTL